MREGKRTRRLSDPAWKNGPKDPPLGTDHQWQEEPILDIDGVGVDEVKGLDGEPLVTVIETYRCRRDACSASSSVRHVYTTADIDGVEITDPTVDGVLVELADSATVTNSEGPEVRVSVHDDSWYIYPSRTVGSHDFDSPCFGREKPSPEPHGL